MARSVNFRITATERTRRAFNSVQRDIGRTNGLMRSMNAGMNRNRRGIQQFGFQVTDFATQIAGGQDAMLAFTQQGGQMLQFFGAGGAMAAAFLAVFGSLAIAFTRSGGALSQLTPLMGVLRNEFVVLGQTLIQVREMLIDFTNLVLNNLDRIIITTTVFVGLWATRAVYAFVAARMAALGLAGALRLVGAALIRIGIGAVIVLIGEAVYQFQRLMEATGGFAAAMQMVGAVISEVMGRVGEIFQMVGLRLEAAISTAVAGIQGLMGGMLLIAAARINTLIGIFVGAYQAVVAAWNALPQAFANLGALAMNALIDKVEAGIGGLVGAINVLLAGLRLPTIPSPDLSQWRQAEGQAGVLGEAIGTAFSNGLNGSYTNGLENVASDLFNRSMANFNNASNLRQLADSIAGLVGRPMQSIQDLMNALDQLNSTGQDIDIRDWFNGSGANGGGGGGGGGGDDAVDELEERVSRIKGIFNDLSKGISSALGDAFKSLFDRTKTFAQTIETMLVKMMEKVLETVTNPIWDALAARISGFLIGTPGANGQFGGGLFSRGMNMLTSFDGGGDTRKGARSGGIDGKGGYMALVHPNERIIDMHRGQSASMFNDRTRDVAPAPVTPTIIDRTRDVAPAPVMHRTREQRPIVMPAPVMHRTSRDVAPAPVMHRTREQRDNIMPAAPVMHRTREQRDNIINFPTPDYRSGADRVASFEGGGSTWKGSRSGGMDGKGGKLIMAHPNERIIDMDRDTDRGGVDISNTFEIHVHENARKDKTEVQQNGNRLDIFVREAVADVIGEGGADRAMRSRYGVRPKAQGR